ncbi:MAG: hypothetical protein BGO95_00615 [Micrococcales bacterium 73-13]|nr:MAG: hypothetical protein BGO95_00615 [Micrococcales bacterium 73-13]
MLEVRDLRKSFGSVPVLEDVSLSVRKGERLVLLGPSGSGKTTLLRCMNLLEQPDGGTVEFRGAPVWSSESRRGASGKELTLFRSRVEMVFQHFELFPHLTAAGNVALGPQHVLGLKRREALEIAREQLASVGLADLAGAYPSTLSGGQKQRVAIARALAMSPDVVLFDEPTAALDPELVGEVLRSLRALAERGLTMIIVTHHIGFALSVADRAVFMASGSIVEQGPPETVLRDPREPRTRDFLRAVLAE